jgi:alanyl-tRNA synthetase
MPTDRLYFSDPYLVTFTARVTERGVLAGRPAVLLDRSAFYPEGGGQPADHGTLNGVPVFDVQVDESGAVWHAVTGALSADSVEGVVDWTRRFDHMQQHHGQHLLSAAFENLFAFRTVSFHLGTDSATIDLAARELTRDHVKAAEDLTNRIIWEDHPVNARFVTREEMATIPLRKAPVVDGPVRVVSAGDFDHSACGGTHPRTTGAVGLLHIRRVERRGTESRVEFVAGGRALRDLRFAGGLVSRMAAGMTVGPEELEVAVARLRESEERSHKRVQKLVEELAGFEADRLVTDGRVSKQLPVIRLSFTDRSMQELRYLAGAIAVRGGIAVLGLSGEKSQIIVTRPSESSLDCGKVLKDTLAQFGGKGGGQPAIAQGGLPDGSQLEAALDLAVRNVAAATPVT